MKIPVAAPRGARRTYSAFFRSVNDDLFRLGPASHLGIRLIVCECSKGDCAEALEVTCAEYESVRAHATRFLVAPGHELSTAQRVLTQTRRFAVIQESQMCLAAPPAATNGLVETNGKRPRVLVADDDPAIRMLCAVNMNPMGLTVLEAADGRRALEQARSERPDLVVSDVKMPGLDGFELAAALRGSEHTRKIPVIFITGETDAATEQRAHEVGAIACLRKPFDPLGLASLVAGVLARFAGAERPVLAHTG